jgi:hypothetical protein
MPSTYSYAGDSCHKVSLRAPRKAALKNPTHAKNKTRRLVDFRGIYDADPLLYPYLCFRQVFLRVL